MLRTAADQGIKRIVQASSINAVGLLFTHDSRRIIDELPLTEESPRRPEDPYSKFESRFAASSDVLSLIPLHLSYRSVQSVGIFHRVPCYVSNLLIQNLRNPSRLPLPTLRRPPNHLPPLPPLL